MSSQSDKKYGFASGTLWILQLIFLVLQITSLVHWSWWAVFIPTYITVGLIVLLLVVGLIGIAVTKAVGPSTPPGLRGRN